MTNPSRPLRLAILGAGRMAGHHVRALSGLERAPEVVLLVDSVQRARDKLSGLCPTARAVAHVDEAALRGVVDVVHVCTPPDSHALHARMALEAGCHVYVEKPFASTRAEADGLLAFARERGLTVCAGHQLLFERPTLALLALRRHLDGLSHIESYFAFRPTRAGMSTEEQLKDVLPHPLYLLLHFLEVTHPESETRIEANHVGADGTIHALVSRGGVVGSLVVTLTGRPVESYLKVVGSNGTVQADYVRGTVLRAIGPGSSTIDKTLQPFRTARQLVTGTVGSLGRRFVRRQRSYPGLAEIFEAFYGAILKERSAPLSDEHILHTVAVAEEIGTKIDAWRGSFPRPRVRTSTPDLQEQEARSFGPIVVTGGTGFLGREVVSCLLAEGLRVRVLSRRVPAPWERFEGVDYRMVDLGDGCPRSALDGCSGVIHCAAETRGGWEEHQRNSIDATEALVRASAAAGISRFVHVSSVAVLRSPGRGAELREGMALEPHGQKAGPYVWGKLNAERLAVQLARDLGLPLKVARPGAIVDYRAFEPPGRLGRRIGNLFIAVGPRSGRIGIVSVTATACTLVWMIQQFDVVPEELNVVGPELPTRRELVDRLKDRNPDLRVIWLPRIALGPLSAMAVIAQKVLRPGREPVHLSRAFSAERYDTRRFAAIHAKIVAGLPGAVASSDSGTAPPRTSQCS